MIHLRGVTQHNLASIDLDIPLGKMIGICGVSGSGKSTLAFHVIHAEGQRRYVETFSPYVRQFLERLTAPSAQSIENIPPTIALESGTTVKNARSTVGTLTDINDYLKLLYSLDMSLEDSSSSPEAIRSLVEAVCPNCNIPIRSATVESILSWLKVEKIGERFLILAPLNLDKYGFNPRELIYRGFVRIYTGGRQIHLEEDPITENISPPVFVVVDRVAYNGQEDETRIAESLRVAMQVGEGIVELAFPKNDESGSYFHYSFNAKKTCPQCGFVVPVRRPELFSFNSPLGACPECKGFGRIIGVNPDLVVPDKTLSLSDGAIKPWPPGTYEYRDLMKFCWRERIPTDVPFEELSQDARDKIFNGTADFYGVKGFFEWLEEKRYKVHVRVFLSRYRAFITCPVCGGTRYRKETGIFRLLGTPIYELQSWSITKCLDFFKAHREILCSSQSSSVLSNEIIRRLKLLDSLRLGYLSLDRSSRTLSGGEVQRVHLVRVLGSGLSNVLYIMDEPSTGLHPRDQEHLVKALRRFVEQGNTVLVVDHDPDILSACDELIELGPGGGKKGGRIIARGTPPELASNPESITGRYLLGCSAIGELFSVQSERDRMGALPCVPVPDDQARMLIVKDTRVNNLKNISVRFPLGRLIGVSGVSGAGKTTLVRTVLYSSWLKHKRLPVEDEIPPGSWKMEGLKWIDNMMFVDHRPVARTPRANLMSYAGIMSIVRNLLANTDEAREKGYGPGFFSFNQPGGRCEVCQGEGYEHHEMQFLADVYSECPACHGKRFKKEALEIRYKGWNIADFLDATAEDVASHFSDHPTIMQFLKPFFLLQLHHLKLGQPLATLSAGESQRLKLVPFVREMLALEKAGTRSSGKSCLILDEPSRGLHPLDLENLSSVLRMLVDRGHTVIMVEHNLQLLSLCDWIIDLGPGSGDEGGKLVYEGSVAGLMECAESATGLAMKNFIERRLRGQIDQSFRFASVVSNVKPSLDGFTKSSGSEKNKLSRETKVRDVILKGVRHHSLNIEELKLPLGAMIAITGVSGSGKSTLAFDVLFSEGQRRYLECLSSYVRNYFPLPERPTIDLLEGLPPTVAVEQRLSRLGNKSTVGTVTEIYHFLRVLFAKAGEQHCPGCGHPVEALTEDELIARIEHELSSPNPPLVLSPVVYRRKGVYRDLANKLDRMGFQELRVDGVWMKPSELASSLLSRFTDHTIEGKVPLSIPFGDEAIEWLRKALKLSDGLFMLVYDDGKEEMLSLRFFCHRCQRSFMPLEPRLFSFNSPYGACLRCDGTGGDENGSVCPACGGSRLNEQARAVKWAGRAIHEWTALSVDESLQLWENIEQKLNSVEFSRWREVLEAVKTEIISRLRFLMDVGLGYLTLDRSGDTLSGGEVQRIRLAAHLGSNLCGVFYVLDEPTIGLHPSDNHKLLQCLKKLRDRGNTVLVVEHDQETLRAADVVVELGPGAGRNGGRVVAKGRFEDLLVQDGTLTGRSFGNELCFEELETRRRPVNSSHKNWLTVRSISIRNFNGVDVSIPLGTLTCITGVSGSGKSTLLFDVVKVGLERALSDKGDRVRSGHLPFSYIEGYEGISRVQEVDHQPIGRTSRSIPATYIGIWDEIRKIFASLPAAKALGFTPAHFSFNIDGGRCEMCKGQGVVVEKMGFLPDVTRTCPACGGTRFKSDVLSVRHRGCSIADVLAMTFDEAGEHFKAYGLIAKPVEIVRKLGLGYLTLGQPSSTLSGGEAQRIKLVKELQKQSRPTVFMLDEPTTGLHRSDIVKLVAVLRDLVDRGHTVLVIEHNMDFVRLSDYIIDIGPEGGIHGGNIVACGTPEEMKAFVNVSRTARALWGLGESDVRRSVTAMHSCA
ncbi:MAG: excinuclease ABC subunit UvrA [Thermodesulforhabdaceae bacterium]